MWCEYVPVCLCLCVCVCVCVCVFYTCLFYCPGRGGSLGVKRVRPCTVWIYWCHRHRTWDVNTLSLLRDGGHINKDKLLCNRLYAVMSRPRKKLTWRRNNHKKKRLFLLLQLHQPIHVANGSKNATGWNSVHAQQWLSQAYPFAFFLHCASDKQPPHDRTASPASAVASEWCTAPAQS